MNRKKGFKFNCSNCGKEVECPPSRKSGGLKYCSRECWLEHRVIYRVRKSCPVCHQEFDGMPQAIYCSAKCKRKIQHDAEKVHRVIRCPDCGQEREALAPAYKRPTRCSACAAKYRLEIRPTPKRGEELRLERREAG